MTKESETAQSTLVTKLIKVLKEHAGVEDEIRDIEIYEPPELKGEHMATETVYGKVLFKDQSLKPKNIFIKKFSGNAVHTEWVKQMKVMEKEASFFNELLPYAKKFCHNNTGIDNFLDCFPNHLYADDEIVVLNNLVLDDSYVMLPKEKKQDLETAKLVLQHLAKWHAVTHEMVKEFGPQEFRKKWELNIDECFVSDKSPHMKDMFENIIGTCLTILNKYDVLAGQEETVSYLSSMLGTTNDMVDNLLNSNRESDGFVVLNHGDCWNNNMLFKLDPVTGKASEHIFVDFQITRFGSPCLDLGYFLYTSVKPEVRRANFQELLKYYYDQFQKSLQLFGHEVPLTFDDFVKDYKKNSRLGFLFNLSMISYVGAFKEFDMESFGTDPEKVMEQFNIIMNNWIEKNSDKTEPIAKELIAVVREEKKLLDLS